MLCFAENVRYILMAEPDHIFVKPFPTLARDNGPTAFPFFYITPSEHEKVIRKYYPEERGPVTDIDPIGNSPVIIKKVFSYCRHDTLCISIMDLINFDSVHLILCEFYFLNVCFFWRSETSVTLISYHLMKLFRHLLRRLLPHG
jgi:hypothetical protein